MTTRFLCLVLGHRWVPIANPYEATAPFVCLRCKAER